ncbi:MAG TPA: L,D-transpeptidase [Pyrinomonadaceae bacterium]|nr:L,D-transpeptidase [Pyrinomonadaceae bacterium]
MRHELKEPEIVIRKKERLLEIYEAGGLLKTFSMVLGFAPAGDKEVEGDGRTPEGEFYVFGKNSESKFHLSLGLSYPSKKDAARGLEAGVISESDHDEIAKKIDAGKMPPQKTALGGEIYIHGGGTASDWTQGCIAMKDDEIEELFRLIPAGTKVTILP